MHQRNGTSVSEIDYLTVSSGNAIFQHIKAMVCYPASCAARIRREEAFAELYELENDSFYNSRSEVDATYRKLEDYVLSALVYDQSKTCC